MVLIAAGIGLTLMFAPALAWGSTLMVGTLVGLAVLKGLIAEPLAAKLVEDHLDELSRPRFSTRCPSGCLGRVS